MLIEINSRSWEKYNPRSDAKKFSWFRFQNNFFDDPVIFDLRESQKLLLIYLYARRNEAGKLSFQLNPRQSAIALDSTTEKVLENLRALADAGLICVRDEDTPHDTNADVRPRTATDAHVPERPLTFSTDGRTDDTNGILPPPPQGSGGPACSDFDHAMAAKWSDWAVTVSRTVKPHPDKWAHVFRLLREKDGFTEVEIAQVFEFVKVDPFWGTNAVSADSLRNRGTNGLKKFENVLRSANDQGRRRNGAAKPRQNIPVITGDNLEQQLLGD